MISISECFRKWRGFFAWSALLLFLILGEQCTLKEPTREEPAPESTGIDTLPGDFVSFFNRFHEDSSFQLEHILFPLEGLPVSQGDGDTLVTTRYFWQKADWKKHNRFTDPGRNFTQWYEVANDQIIEHWIQMNGTNMFMYRRFAKLKDGWYLIYYQGLRPMKK